MKRCLLAFVLAFVSSTALAGTVVGTINKPNGQPLQNGTISFGLSQAGSTVGSAVFVTTDTAYCATDPGGAVVGIAAPAVPPVLSGNYGAGTLPGSTTYYVQYTYVGDSGETTASPESSFLMVSSGTLMINGPTLHPSGATGYSVYLGTTSGGETLQFSVPNFNTSGVTSSALAGNPVPATNTTICQMTFNDAIIPANTTYSVNIITPDGKQVGGFPQRFYLAGGTVDLSQLTPAGNIFAKFPTAIIAQPSGNGVQSIAGPLNLGAYDLTANTLHLTAPQVFSTLVTFNSGIGADGAGFKHIRGGSVCATGASVGATCANNMLFVTPFADSNYTVVCNGDGVTSGVPAGGAITNKVAAGFSFATIAGTAVAAQFTNIDCIAVHN